MREGQNVNETLCHASWMGKKNEDSPLKSVLARPLYTYIYIYTHTVVLLPFCCLFQCTCVLAVRMQQVAYIPHTMYFMIASFFSFSFLIAFNHYYALIGATPLFFFPLFLTPFCCFLTWSSFACSL